MTPTSASLRPFPWASLPRLARLDVYAAHQARASLLPHLAPELLATEASALLRQPVALQPRAISAEAIQPGVRRVTLEFQGTEARCWIEAEPALQLRAVEAALGLAPGLNDPLRGVSPEVEGAWAALLVALARRCARDAAPRLGTPPGPGDAAVLAATVRLGGELFALRVGVPLATIPRTSRFDRAALAGLGAAPLTLALVAACCLATAEDLAGMTPGAAWLPGAAWTLRPGDGVVRPDDGGGTSPQSGGGWSGTGWLASGGSEVAAAVELRSEGGSLALVLGRSCGSLSWDPPMPTPIHDADASEAQLPDALAETPVVIRVEVASVTLEAQQWARLGAGDVVATGVRLGEPVVLRAGGSVFARGELCVLDGELAVKILQRVLPHPRVDGWGVAAVPMDATRTRARTLTTRRMASGLRGCHEDRRMELRCSGERSTLFGAGRLGEGGLKNRPG